ncbi:MAG: carotenoid 1,2-hydratase [Pseudomonadota bacterium]
MGFIGSVFSPWYRWSGRRRPENHCCINVATYGRGGRFAMTDRGVSALRLSQNRFEVGPSAMTWTGRALEIDINEVSSLPLINRLRGKITLTPSALTDVEAPLTDDGAHVWRPFAPTAHISVEIDRPGWQWQGHGYFDANFGTRALEADFDYWTWGRYPGEDGSFTHYDALRRDGSRLALALRFGRDGDVTPVTPPPRTAFARTAWAVRRETRADLGYVPRQMRAMLDAPFYARSVVRTQWHGQTVTGVHEALDLTRFRGPWLMPMLAVRVPRRPGWAFPATG